jgi:hypothetical protein
MGLNDDLQILVTVCDSQAMKISKKTDIGAPSLDWVAVDTVGLAYYEPGEGLKYAYPHTSVGSWTANCGPDPKAWRCISILGATGTTGKVVKFRFGINSFARGIAFTYDDAFIENTLYYAEYVGTGGNCGADKNPAGMTIYKWQCSDVDLLTYNPAPSYSVAVDDQGYGVIAYTNALSDLSAINLYLAYPKARVGSSDPGWMREKIDGAPTTTVKTGVEAALSFNHDEIGLIGYLQEEDYMLPDVKVARQFFENYLPSIRK